MDLTGNRFRCALPVVLSALAWTFPADANTKISLETVSDYSFICGGASHSCDTDADTEGQGFWNPMTASGSPWTVGYWFEDTGVFDTDFYDPDLTGDSLDNDTHNFDTSSTALSYVIAHGSNPDWTTTNCASDADCPANSYCPDFPHSPSDMPVCISQTARVVLTSSQYSSHNNAVWYGFAGGGTFLSFALGEDSVSGSFDGAGTNGGSNVVVITNSIGFRSRYLYENTARFFGGAHLLMFNMAIAAYSISDFSGVDFSDTAQWSARGSTFATNILSNTNAPAMSAWLDPTFTDNNYNANSSGDNKSGVNVVMAQDPSSEANAQSRVLNETWQQTLDEGQDATGNGWFYWAGECNFANCSNYTL